MGDAYELLRKEAIDYLRERENLDDEASNILELLYEDLIKRLEPTREDLVQKGDLKFIEHGSYSASLTVRLDLSDHHESLPISAFTVEIPLRISLDTRTKNGSKWTITVEGDPPEEFTHPGAKNMEIGRAVGGARAPNWIVDQLYKLFGSASKDLLRPEGTKTNVGWVKSE